MQILWGVKKDDPDYMEEIITNKEERIEQAKAWAIKNGYDRFRVADIDNEKPDFVKTINI